MLLVGITGSIGTGKSTTAKMFKDYNFGVYNADDTVHYIYENDMIIDLSKNENFLEYFLDDNYNIPERKQVILRRMLLGLTSYYPIDRSSIANMPEVVEP